MKKMHGVDMGIALAHLTVAAEEFWYSPQITKLSNISEQNFKRHKYIITVLLSQPEREFTCEGCVSSFFYKKMEAKYCVIDEFSRKIKKFKKRQKKC